MPCPYEDMVFQICGGDGNAVSLRRHGIPDLWRRRQCRVPTETWYSRFMEETAMPCPYGDRTGVYSDKVRISQFTAKNYLNGCCLFSLIVIFGRCPLKRLNSSIWIVVIAGAKKPYCCFRNETHRICQRLRKIHRIYLSCLVLILYRLLLFLGFGLL